MPSRWSNAAGNVRVFPGRREQPRSARELGELVREAERAGQRIRMTGSGHSFSDVAVTSDILLGPKCLDETLPIDAAQIRSDRPPKPGRRLIRVQSGTTIRQLNDRTWRSGLALENLGGYDGQTIVGAATTGTHGSGLDYGPIASQVVSLQVVSVGGEMLQIEPTLGVTDPATFRSVLPEDESVSVRLIQDDALFHAASVSMGCLGIVYAVVLEVQRRFWIRERRTLTTWNALTLPGGFIHELLRTGSAPTRPGEPKPDHYEVYLNPHPVRRQGTLEYSALLTERFKLAREPVTTTNDRRRGQWYTSLGTFFGVLADRLGSIPDYLNRNPEKGPELIETALRGLRDDRYVNRSYRVYNLGGANEGAAIGIEMAFDLAQTRDAVAHLCAMAAEQRWQGRTHGIPVALRFVAPSPAYLAMQHGRPTMMMEICMLSGLNYAEDILTEYQHMFMSRMNARPHWGLDLGVIRDTNAIAALYPDWPKWRRAYETLNPNGTFDGDFTDRIGLSTGPRT